MATGKASKGVVAAAEIDRAETQEEISYEVSSGNVYADLGFDDAEEMAAKISIKMVPVLVLFIFPALMIVVLGPAIVAIMRQFLKM